MILRQIVILVMLLQLFKLSSPDEATSCRMRLLLGLPKCGPMKTPLNTTYQFCNIPHPYLDDVKETMTCDLLAKYNPACNANFTLAYSNSPPYIYKDVNGNAHGMMLGKHMKLLIITGSTFCNDNTPQSGLSYDSKILL